MAAAGLASESNRGGADGTVGEEEEKRGELLFEMPQIRFTKLFINGSFVDAASGTSPAPTQCVRISLPASIVPLLQCWFVSCFRIPIHTRVETDRSGSLIAIAPVHTRNPFVLFRFWIGKIEPTAMHMQRTRSASHVRSD